MSPGPAAPGESGRPTLEDEWERLRRQVALAEGFWLGFVEVTVDAAALRIRERLERLLDQGAARFRAISPRSPDAAVEDVLGVLLAEPDARTPVVTWVDLVRVDPFGGPTPWREALARVVMRLNERREALRRSHFGGLLLALRPEGVTTVRELAPDLWAFRSLVVRAADAGVRGVSPVGAEPGLSFLRQVPDEPRSPEGSADLYLDVLTAPDRVPKDPATRIPVLVRAVEHFLRDGRVEEAADAARSARAAAEAVDATGAERSLLLAKALRSQFLVASARGDLHAAAELVDAAVAALSDSGDAGASTIAGALAAQGETRSALGDHVRARSSFRAAVDVVRRRIEQTGPSMENERYLMSLLTSLGRECAAVGDLEGGRACFEEALMISRGLVARSGGDAEQLLGLCVSLYNLGRAHFERGELSGALASFEESVDLGRRLSEKHGDTPASLRVLSASLSQRGAALAANGALTGARASLEEALALDRRFRTRFGETPDAHRQLLMTLSLLAHVLRDLRAPEAATVVDEALLVGRRIADAPWATDEDRARSAAVLSSLRGSGAS